MLTNSFCRCFWIACESFLSAHVNKATITCKRNLSAFHVRPLVISPTFSFTKHLQSRLYSSKKKKWHQKTQAQTLPGLKRANPMSDSLQPSSKASHGGKFEVSSTEEANVGKSQWMKSPATPSSSVQAVPTIPSDFRVWEPVSKRANKYQGPAFKFKVVSYNVLAQYLLECHPYLYTGCSPNDLKWNVRGARLYEEIKKLAPDILCLQEVQASHLKTFYKKFEDIGYRGVFKQKTGHRNDGCAIYFRESIFKMLDHVGVEYYQPELPILNRDNVGVMVKLVARSAPDTPFVVATTHLLYNPKRTDVRLAQLQVFLAEIDRFAFYSSGNECGHMPIILTGDLNSTPDSAVIRLLDRGQVSVAPFRDGSDWRRIGVTDSCQHLAVILKRQQGIPNVDFSQIKINNSDVQYDLQNESSLNVYNYSHFFNCGVVGHSLNFMSVYDRVKSDGHQEASTYQDCWVTVDYIYFSCFNKLKLVQRLRLPTTEECLILGTIPNHIYASDHLALGAVFELSPRSCNL